MFYPNKRERNTTDQGRAETFGGAGAEILQMGTCNKIFNFVPCTFIFHSFSIRFSKSTLFKTIYTD